MAGFRFFIDGQAVEEPIGWQDFEEALVLEHERRVLRFDYPLELSFYGLAYEILDNQYKANFNSQVEFIVFDNRTGIQEKIIQSIIKMSNCHFNLTTLICRTELDDATYQSYVFNNFSTKALINSEMSKNGVPITPITSLDLILYDPETGENIAGARKAYDVFECFRMMFQFISDGKVEFASSWYDSLPDNEKLAILTGRELRDAPQGVPITLALKDLFSEIWKKYNLFFIVENPLISPVIRLEEEQYLYQTKHQIYLPHLKDVERSLDVDKLYNTIELGTEIYIRDYGTEYMLPYFLLFGFSEETFNISGVIGVENTLNLKTKWVTDHNVIQQILGLPISTDDYDDDIFLIQYTINEDGTTVATKGEYYSTISGEGRFYNEQLLNSNVAARFRYYGNIILNSGILESEFRAERTTSSNITDYVGYPYDDDSTPPNFDAGDNYDTALYRYTSPLTLTAPIRFQASIIMLIGIGDFGVPQYKVSADMRFLRSDGTFHEPTYSDIVIVNIYDSSFNLQSTTVTDYQNASGQGVVAPQQGWYMEFIIERTVLMEEGQWLMVAADVESMGGNDQGNLSLTLGPGGFFRTIATPNNGGDFQNANPDEAYIGIYDADNVIITDDQWSDVRAVPTMQFQFDTGKNDPRKAYAKRIIRKLVSGDTEIELSYNRMQPNI